MTGKGAQWSSFTQPASVDDNFSLMHAMIMLVIDSLILLILTWYLDNVRPGTFGVPRPWYFPFQVVVSLFCTVGMGWGVPPQGWAAKQSAPTVQHHM